MEEYKNLRAAAAPAGLVRDAFHVHVYENTEAHEETIEDVTITYYTYDEKRYTRAEYAELLRAEQAETLSYLESQLTDTQIALCDVYELLE